MLMKPSVVIAFVLSIATTCFAQDQPKPPELKLLKSYVGVWDADIEVWPMGLDAASVKFKGVETNRPYGEHWIASDFDSEYQGETTKVHSIIGYDRDNKRMIATVIDHGPYAASMTGDYDPESKTVSWMTKVKAPNGSLVVQKTVVTQTSDDERTLVLSVPSSANDDFTKFMEINFIRRK